MVKESLDDHAEAYTDTFKYALDNDLILNEYAKRIASRLSGGSLMELGIGHGITTEIFSQCVSRHLVIEGSGAIIKKFREKKNLPDTEIIESFFENFETKEKFDYIIMGFILEHVDVPEVIVTKFKKFLAESGSIFVAAPNSEALNRRLGYEAGMLEDLERLSDSDRLLGHKRYLNLKKLRTLAERSGMKVVSEGLFGEKFQVPFFFPNRS